MKTVYLNQTPIHLDPAQLIQAGGEGMVFEDGPQAIKLYHHPYPDQPAKLRDLQRLNLPANVLGPHNLVANQAGETIGFTMPLLPKTAVSFKKLSQPKFWLSHAFTAKKAMSLLCKLHGLISQLHQQGIIIGDLNEHNAMFAGGEVYLIDVDSYQFDTHPCPVALRTFLDPNLYHIADFRQQPYFSVESDWYAFGVLVTKTLLAAHPFGGVHARHKTIEARAQAGVSLFHPSVIYPQRARPPHTLPSALKAHLLTMFEQQKRPLFPANLLSFPTPKHRATVKQPTIKPPSNAPDLGLFAYEVPIANGRFAGILRQDDQYWLAKYGANNLAEKRPLFGGQAGYRFGLFGKTLAVNPPNRPDLLLLHIGGTQPKQLTLLQTATFRETAVFAVANTVSPQPVLYRIATNWIMRGQLQNGHYVEDAVTTAHDRQTIFWGSPYRDAIAGYHRIFAENHAFIITEGSTQEISLPPMQSGNSVQEIKVQFEVDRVIFERTVRKNGRLQTEQFSFDY